MIFFTEFEQFLFDACLRLQVSFRYLANLSKLVNFYSPWIHQKIVGFLMISGGQKFIDSIKFA